MEKDEAQYGTITYVRLPEDLRQQVEGMAKEETRTMSAQIVVLLRKAIQPQPTERKPRRSKTPVAA